MEKRHFLSGTTATILRLFFIKFGLRVVFDNRNTLIFFRFFRSRARPRSIMVIVSGQPREPYAYGATLALSGARTVWATKMGIVLKNRASLALLGHHFAKFVRFFLRHWYPPSK